MNKKTSQMVLSIVLYVFAGLLAIFAVWSFIYCTDYITQAKEAGRLAVSGNEYDIVNFYVSNCFQYVVLALLLTAAGFILQRKHPGANEPTDIVSPAEGTATDDTDSDDYDPDDYNPDGEPAECLTGETEETKKQEDDD